jgi:hypothetical protein
MKMKPLTRIFAAPLLMLASTIPGYAADAGAPTTCKDGTTSTATGRGACSGHGGVQKAAPAGTSASQPTAAAPAAAAPPASATTQAAPSTPATAAKSAAPKTGAASGNTDPTGATAKCKDGTYSKSRHKSGACSKNGGVAEVLNGAQ